MTWMLDGGWGKGAFPCADVYITPASPPVLAVQTMPCSHLKLAGPPLLTRGLTGDHGYVYMCVLYGSYDCVSNVMHTIYTCLLY